MCVVNFSKDAISERVWLKTIHFVVMCSLKNFVSCDTWGLTSLPLISWESLTGLRWEERQHNAPGPLFRGKLVCEHYVAPCKVIRIPKSRKFLLVESGILGIGIQNPAFGTQNPTKKWIQDPFLSRLLFKKTVSLAEQSCHERTFMKLRMWTSSSGQWAAARGGTCAILV